MNVVFGIPCKNIFRVLGESKIGLESIPHKLNNIYNTYTLWEDIYERTKSYYNWILSEQCGPYFCPKSKEKNPAFSGTHQIKYQYDFLSNKLDPFVDKYS